MHSFFLLSLAGEVSSIASGEPNGNGYHHRGGSRKTSDSTYGSVSTSSGRTSPSNMSVISSTLSNLSLPFANNSSAKPKKASGHSNYQCHFSSIDQEQ